MGQLEHLQALRSKGRIYANTVKYFRNVEAHHELKDSMEGASRNENIKIEKFVTDSGEEVKIDFDLVKLTTFNSEMDYTRLFCTYYFTVDDTNTKQFIDPRIQKFGDYALIITDCKQFFERIDKYAAKYNLTRNPISYYDLNKQYKNLTVFHKPNTYEHQNEYRFHFNISNDKPLEFNIGSIEDISMIVETYKLGHLDIEIKK